MPILTFQNLNPERKKFILKSPRATIVAAITKDTAIQVISYTRESFSGNEIEILKRFSKVFNQAYTRFLDLQKSEAQAREAQIEAALEKVRSRSLAMHKSDELKEVIKVVLEQFIHLKINAEHAGFYIDYKAQDDMHIWLADPNLEPFFAIIPYFDTPTWNSFLDAKAKGIPLHTDLLNFEEKNKFYQSLFKLFTIPEEAKQFYMQCKGLAVSTALLDNVGLYIENFSAIPYTDEENKILIRFGKVFQQTYTRFLDLQKAEAQAREAQIETSLERVRSRSMAMHASKELKDVAKEMRNQFGLLGQKELETCAIHLWDQSSGQLEAWAALRNPDNTGDIIESETRFDIKGIRILEESFQNYLSGKKDYVIISDAVRAKEFFEAIKKIDPKAYDFLANRTKNIKSDGITAYWSVSDFRGGSLVMVTINPPDENSRTLLQRFAIVFGQAYQRFFDLKKAEAQAREAQIETALERVRSRTMSMQKSSELLPTAEIMFDQLKQLGAELQGVAFAICDENSTMVQKWTSIGNFSHPYDIEPGEQRMYEAWKNQSGMYEEVYEGEKQKKYYELFMEIPEFRQGLQKVIDMGFPIPTWQKNYAVPFKNGYVLFIITQPFNETQIFLRFGKVFEQTYTRFLDLQKAEAATKEVIKQAALDRIRADIASMRTTKDLERITPVIWNELSILGIPFVRCGVFIMDEDEQLIHTFLSTPEGKAIAAIHIPYNTPGKIRLIPENWKKKTAYTDHWKDSDFSDFANTLVQNHVFESSEQYLSGIPHGGFYLHFLPFLQGMMYVGNAAQLSDDEINLIQAVADAFSSAYSRYEDFNKLEAAKKQVDSTLTELQATQRQLIQSEKMASLGELTAGIAHEIQNPLNFVNNFSEVSTELIDEMKEELSKSNYEDANVIADDLKQNLEKINHHGKRAGDIVKGMLQHSRKSEGQKEPTDINALCDEYLRLSYHGLRAKDKTFNAEFKTDFDSSLPKMNVVQQDIGRVVLNLINNAFYACAERSRSTVNEKSRSNTGFVPQVTIVTKKLKDNIEISVKDNGNGIPKNIVEKIFQPFFTTKPTGSGTGLGLSLSYDIIKAHGGEIKVETREGKGTEFMIQLPVV